MVLHGLFLFLSRPISQNWLKNMAFLLNLGKKLVAAKFEPEFVFVLNV